MLTSRITEGETLH